MVRVPKIPSAKKQAEDARRAGETVGADRGQLVWICEAVEKKERDRVQHQLSGLNAALAAFAGVYRNTAGTKPRRKISAKGRARIAAAQRARWARVNGQHKVVPISKPKRTMSASARRKIGAAQRKRWAKVRANKAA